MYTQLRAAFPLKEIEIKILTAEVTTPFKETDNIRAFIINQRNILARLAAVGQPLPALLAVEKISKACKSTAIDKKDFAPIFSEFRVVHGAIAQEAVANYTNFVITFVEHCLPHHHEANGTRRHAHAAQEDSASRRCIRPSALDRRA